MIKRGRTKIKRWCDLSRVKRVGFREVKKKGEDGKRLKDNKEKEMRKRKREGSQKKEGLINLR